MADGEEREGSELTREQKKEIAKWFLTNAPVGEIQYVAKDVRSVLMDDSAYEAAAGAAFPIYNKTHLVSIEMQDRSGDVIISKYGEVGDDSYLDPRTAQVAIVDHVEQMCTKVRPAADEELPSSYIEEFRSILDAELCKYVGETYPKGTCAVYCTSGKDAEGPGMDFEFTVVISAARRSPQNFWCVYQQRVVSSFYIWILLAGYYLIFNIKFSNGSWRSIWIVEFKDDLQVVEIKGNIQIDAHYFEEGNVQLDTNNECRDSTIFQSPEDSAIAIANIIRHHETEYMTSLEASYLNLPDTTFKDLRRKLPVTRTLFPWHNTLQFSLTREISKELGIGK
ncbi:hypothetical protein Taro_022995 [Colocasia esculenta]|uniref:F-actin-capping protein subunit alpha n=1 Tax=Colocasia esculenta TaxID=4460 RepID=A0A843UW46_COLES|nr:hypothetical protein [Colocasia esculenta]